MKLYVGVTDNDWFAYLARMQPPPTEINFWQPGGQSRFGAIDPSDLFLFKLHYPLNYIVGGGSFVRWDRFPLSFAWEWFGENNGVRHEEALRAKILHHRGQRYAPELNPEIGCIVLAAPFFFDEPDWIPAPADWSPNIVQGKTYDTAQGIGAQVWQRVLERLQQHQVISLEPTTAAVIPPDTVRYGEYVTRVRLGQATFRALVTEAYQHRCAITGERTLPVLQAAHIKPPPDSGPNVTCNGLLLRADLHILFDQGYITVNPDLRVEVSPRIREDYENGRDYYRYHGLRLEVVPDKELEKPSPEFIAWHNEHVYAA